VALRWDFTVALARMLVRRFPDPPPRISYAGAVFRKPGPSWEPVERSEVGCEYIHEDPEISREVDVELARLLMAVPQALGLKSALLALGHAALLRRPMEAEGLSQPLASRLLWAMERRALHRAAEALEIFPEAGEQRVVGIGPAGWVHGSEPVVPAELEVGQVKDGDGCFSDHEVSIADR